MRTSYRDGIAPRETAGDLYEIAIGHAGPEGRAWIEDAGKVLYFGVEHWPSNRAEFAHEVEYFGGIEPWRRES